MFVCTLNHYNGIILKVLFYNLWNSVYGHFPVLVIYFCAIILLSTDRHLKYFHLFIINSILCHHVPIYFADLISRSGTSGSKDIHILSFNRYFHVNFQEVYASFHHCVNAYFPIPLLVTDVIRHFKMFQFLQLFIYCIYATSLCPLQRLRFCLCMEHGAGVWTTSKIAYKENTWVFNILFKH